MRYLFGLQIAVASILLGHSTPAAAIEIQFDYRFDSSGFFNSAMARNTLEAAADTFDVLLDNLAPIVPTSINQWQAAIFNPANGADQMVPNLSVPADTLLVFAGARNLPGNQLGLGGPGGFGASGTQNWLNTVSRRGEEGATSGPTASEVAPWGGSISFDNRLPDGSTRDWHFDINTDPAQFTNDFFSVAVHELGHLLGFGTTDSFQNARSGNLFNGPTVRSLNGGQGVAIDGSGAHWQPNTTSPPGVEGAPIAAMDPTITSVNGFAERRFFTALDYAVLDDIGWDVDPIVYEVEPEPLPGDYNNNGTIEQGDLDLVLLNWGDPANSVPNTWVNDLPSGQVDQDELDRVLLGWGDTAQGLAFGAAVPEPATWLLACLMLSLISFRRR